MLEDVDGIAAEHLARDPSSAVESVAQRIVTAVGRLRDFPFSGRVVPAFRDPAVREIFVDKYRVVYRIMGNVVELWMVIHTARKFPPDDVTDRKRLV